MIQNVLDSLCEQISGCETLAFADLTTRMVLITNTNAPESQETLNALCLEADLMLKSGSTALMATKDKLHLFLRAENEPNDVLFCICEVGTDFAALLPAAQTCLNTISNGDVPNE